MSNRMILKSVLLMALGWSTLVVAHNNVVVVPLFGSNSDNQEPIQNVVTVAQSGGDFNNVIAAMASISNASANNPYLLVIAPGSYSLETQLIMKPHVEVSGSGRHATTLIGEINSADPTTDAALVVGASNASLRNLSLLNIASSGSSVGFHSNNAN